MADILLLCDDRPSHAPNVLEHIRALQRFSRHDVRLFNPHGLSHSRALRLGDYDAVVVHYTIFALSDNYLAPWFRQQLAAYGGLKVQFIQDEYRQVDATTARMRELGIALLFSSVPAAAVPDVYGPRLPGVEVLSTLTGYVPAALEQRRRPPLTGRELDVVYRGRAIPFWLGRLGQEKVQIGREFLQRAASTGLRCDIGWTEAERIYGEDWYRFLRSSLATLGTESGASIVDFDGSLQTRTDAYLAAHPGASFDEVEREILAPFEGNAVIQTISPRVFEAAALGSVMINFTGRYSGAIEPWVHYVPLEKDFSNFAEVVEAIRDDALLDRVAARAHGDLVASGDYSLRRFVDGFDLEVEARIRPLERRPRSRAARSVGSAALRLEQLRSPARRADLPIMGSLRSRAFDRAGSRLIARFPEIEALSAAPRDARQREQLNRDLVRLAAATAAHLRELRYLGRPFDVRPELSEDDRRLTLVGVPEPEAEIADGPEIGERVRAAIAEGRLEEIVWNNSGSGSLTLLSFPISWLEVGYHVTVATHRFTALMALAHDDPDGVIAALQPLFRPRPDEPVYELDRKTATLIRVLWLSPGQSAAKGAAALRAVVSSKELRRLLRAYLRDPAMRAAAPADLFLKDCLALQRIGESAASLELSADRTTLVYRTNGSEAPDNAVLDVATVRSLEQIVWEDGGYEFDALTRVARRFPELAAPALAGAAGAD